MFSSEAILIVGLLAAAWLLQIFLSSWQMKRFHDRTRAMRRLGKYTSVGVSGSMYKRKVYTVIAVDEEGRVAAAERLSGSTVMAGAKPVPEVVGLHLDEIGRGDPPDGVDQKTWDSFDMGADFIRKKLAREAESTDSDEE